MFEQLIALIHESKDKDFREKTIRVRKFIDKLSIVDFKQMIKDIGTIPEIISHDSSEEKLYSKASDIVLARCFRELGLSAKALDERADSADILAESVEGYNYSLVADAKCFRLSRTAKNQKDFKVGNLSAWRGSENEYAVLVAPYFQYPQVQSQIYSSALERNVCLLSWEQVSLLIEHGVRETDQFSLESLWNASQMMARDSRLVFANAKKCFLPKMDEFVAKKMGMDSGAYANELGQYKKLISYRGRIEIRYWEDKIEEIMNYTKEQAIDELILALKLNEKISSIRNYLGKLGM